MSLEVRDKDKVATFIDNVKLVQGDTMLECKRLIVYYDEEGAPAGKKRKPATARSTLPGTDPAGEPADPQLEAKGGVVVTQKDQIATGDNGIFDMKTNTIVLTGNVTLTQGQNVVRGDRALRRPGHRVVAGRVRRPARAPGPGAVPAAAPRRPPNRTSRRRTARRQNTGLGVRSAAGKDKPKYGGQSRKLN